jgi:hypothetical protein
MERQQSDSVNMASTQRERESSSLSFHGLIDYLFVPSFFLPLLGNITFYFSFFPPSANLEVIYSSYVKIQHISLTYHRQNLTNRFTLLLESTTNSGLLPSFIFSEQFLILILPCF